MRWVFYKLSARNSNKQKTHVSQSFQHTANVESFVVAQIMCVSLRFFQVQHTHTQTHISPSQHCLNDKIKNFPAEEFVATQQNLCFEKNENL